MIVITATTSEETQAAIDKAVEDGEILIVLNRSPSDEPLYLTLSGTTTIEANCFVDLSLHDLAFAYIYNTSSAAALDNSAVMARDKATVIAQDKATVYAYNYSEVYAYNDSHVYAHDRTHVHARISQ